MASYTSRVPGSAEAGSAATAEDGGIHRLATNRTRISLMLE
jgi:hypothetical protein